jgi:hypothetical protein
LFLVRVLQQQNNNIKSKASTSTATEKTTPFKVNPGASTGGVEIHDEVIFGASGDVG